MYSRRLLGVIVFVVLLAWKTHSQAASAPLDLDDEASPSLAQTTDDRIGCCEMSCCPSPYRPRWTATAEFILLERCGGASRTLVERVPGVPTSDRVPGSASFGRLFTAPGEVALTGNDFRQGFSGGPKLDLIRRGDSGYDLELSYFQIDGWRSDRTIVPSDADECLVMRTPGEWISPAVTPGGWSGWIQTNQDAAQAFAWSYASQIHDAEFNVRWTPADRVTMLAGFRWLNLDESLVAALSPATIATEPPFWDTRTSNKLYGFQIGAACKLFERGRFSIDGRIKTGIYDNDAEQTTAVSVIAKQVRSASATTNHAAFVGETGLSCRYRINHRLALKAGYELLWLEGVALAPGQIENSFTTTKIFENSVRVSGVNCNSGVFYHGATLGVEGAF